MKKPLLLLIITLFTIGLVGCKKADSYTEEEHINNVSKIIEDNYLTDGVTYELRPLYDHNDKLSFFVVDFSNDKYLYIKIQNKDRSLLY